MRKYKVIAQGFYTKDGEAKIGDIIDIDGGVEHLIAKVELIDDKQFEVATPKSTKK